MSGRGGATRGGGGWRGGRGSGAPSGRGPDLPLPDDVEVRYAETPLFPDYQPQPFKPMSEEEERTVDQWKKFVESLKDLPYYLDVPPPKPDIERYSDQFRATQNKKKSLTTVATDLSFFPDELHGVKDPTKKTGPRRANIDFDVTVLDAMEKEENAKGGEGQGGDEDEEPLPEEEYDEEVDEEENDYLVDHYDEDHDVLGGDASDREEW